MYRFKASKYKNANPGTAKKEECITDVTVETPMTYGNFVAASAKLVAFCSGPAGSGKVMVLDKEAKGCLGSGPALNAHNDSITALEFSPFNHCQLATASADNTVKIWSLSENGIVEDFSGDAIVKLTGFTERPECIAFNPVAENILAIASGSKLVIANIDEGENVLEMDVECDLIQNISWKKDGTLIAVTSKDARLFICNPRDGATLAQCKAHHNHKESRVTWIGDSDSIITTGFSSGRDRQVKVWKLSNGSLSCLATEDFSMGTGVLMPFYDEDTGMLLLAAKGDSSVYFVEYFEGKTPPLQLATSKLLQAQTKGMCALPKLGVNAVGGEVNRLYQLCQKMLVPIPWIVPRRSLRDFPADLFPDTASDEPALTAEEWLDGANEKRNLTSLDPSKRSTRSHSKVVASKQSSEKTVKKNAVASNDVPVVAKPMAKPRSSEKVEKQPAVEEVKTKYKPFTGVRQSKFRHWKCKADHPSRYVTNIEPISMSTFPSSDLLRCSELYGAVPLKGNGGPVAIIELSKPGRMVDGNSLVIHNSKSIVDIQWNPFNASQITVALETSDIKVWNIPSSISGQSLEEADLTYSDHYAKPVVLCYHPLAENLIASGDVEGRILIWDTVSGDTYFDIACGDSELLSLSWSRSGRYLAASTKDKKIRVFEPRKSTEAIQVGPGPPVVRSSRMVWACDDKFIAVSGFDLDRVIYLYGAENLSSGPVSSLGFPNTPSVLMLHYDADSSTLLFTGKGDMTMYSAEVSEAEPPHLFPLAVHSFESAIQGFSFLSKKKIEPRKVEFALAWCLTKNTLQGFSFTVPRVKMEYFQDDLFPPTAVTWEKTMSASDWVAGSDKLPRKLNLRPSDMKPLSEAPQEEMKPKKYQSYDATTYKTDEQKKEELLEAMSGKLDLDKQLEQDTMEGVDEDEWDDY